MASDILPNDAWRLARERFVEDLDESEKARFVNATFENVFYSASAAQKTHEATSVSRALAAKMNTLLMGIDGWAKALDVYSNASATIVSPVWGSIRVLIQLSSEFGKYFDYLIDMLAQIGEVVPRFQIYERLFPSHLRLTQALATAYLDVIVFCTTVKAVFKRAKRHSMVNLRILLKVAWRTVDKDFGTFMTRFQQHRKAVEKQAGISNLLEEAKAREIEGSILLQLEKQKNEEERIKVLSMLSSVQWDKQHWKALKQRHKNTGTWIFDLDVFKEWKETTSSGCLRCNGIPGCGKTILTAGVIEALSLECDSDRSATAYFYCDYADSITLDLNSIVGTIIQQLLIVQPVIAKSVISNIRELYGDGLRHPSPESLIELLCSIINKYTVLYIFLDGIDETSLDTQNGICGLITTLIAVDTTIVKIFVSSRQSSLIGEALELYPEIVVSESSTVHDVNAYITASVEEKLASHSVIQNNPGLQAEVERQLMMKAQGMFLWVFFQLEELSDPSHSDNSFRTAINNLPKGLNETYQRIVQKVARKPERQVAQAQKIFIWTLNARRHLTLLELREAIAIDPGDKYWDRSKISTESDGKRLVENCGALVLFDQTDNTVRLAHHTVSQFLRHHTFFSVEGQEDFVADICFTYLSFADFETQITLTEKKPPIKREQSSTESSFSHIVQLLGFNKTIYDFLLRLYNRGDGRLLPDVDYVELLKKYQKASPSVPLEEKYKLLSYVRHYWIWHVVHFEKDTTVVHLRWKRLRDLVFSKHLLFDFRPWGISDGPKGLPHLTVFLWALEAAHKPLILLLQEKAPLSSYLKYSTETQVRQLITKGQLDILTLLMREDSSIASNQDFMHQAFQLRRVDTLRLLFTFTCGSYAGINVRHFLTRRHESLGDPLGLSRGGLEGITGLKPLHVAAFEGNVGLSRLLLEYGAEVEGTDSTLKTPLFYACCPSNTVSRHDMVDTIQLFLSRRVIVDARDAHGNTVLQYMLKQPIERDEVVGILIAEGADLHSKNNQGESILQTAISHAPASTLRLLRGKGLALEVKDSLGLTLLFKALGCENPLLRSEERAVALIAMGADVNAHDDDKMMPLHLAVRANCSLAVVKSILDAGADVNVYDKDKTTALHLAVKNRTTAVVKSILDAGAKIDLRDSSGRLALDIAVASGSLEMVNTFIAYGINLRLLDPRWEPALIHPIRHGRNSMVEALLSGGADPNTMDHGYPPKSALTCAAIYNRIDIADMLIRYGAVVQTLASNDLFDPFRWAVTQGNNLMLRLLLKNLTSHEKENMSYLWDYTDLHSATNIGQGDRDGDAQRDLELMKDELRRLGVPSSAVR